MLKTHLDPHWNHGNRSFFRRPAAGCCSLCLPMQPWSDSQATRSAAADRQRAAAADAFALCRRFALRDCWWCSRLLSPPAPRGAAGMLRRRRRRWRRRRSQDSPVTQEQGISLNLSVLWVVCSNPPLRLLLECPHYQSSSLTPQVRNAIGASRPWRIPCKIAHSLQSKLCHSSSR